MITKRENTPFELKIENKDMQAVATTQYQSELLDVRQHFVYTAIVDITETGAPTVGAAKLFVRVISKDKTTVLYEVDLVTGITTIVNGQRDVITFGAGVTAIVFGSGTIGPDADVFKTAERIRLVLEVTTQNDGTTSTASVTLLMGS